MMKSLTLLGYRDFFTSGEPNDKLTLANRIGSDDLLNAISFLMGSIHKQGQPEINQFLREWFTYFYGHDHTKSPSYTVLADRLETLQKMRPETTFTIISVEALLRMFLWIRENQDKITPKGSNADASVTLDLFEIVTLFNDEVIANVKKGRASAQSTKDNLIPYREVLTLAFSSNDFVNVDLAQLFYCQIFKAARLMDFLENTPKYQQLHQKILADFGAASNKEYIQAISSLIWGALGAKPGKTTIVIPDGPDKKKNIDLFEKIAIQPSTALADYDQDFRELRAAPLYKVAEGEYRVVNDPFLINTIYNGLTFYCSRLCSADPNLLKVGGKDFFGGIRLDFSEKVLLYEICNSIFSAANDVKLTGEQTAQIVGKEGRESDFFVHRNQKAAIFESKDFLMSGEEKLSYDFTTIEAGLKRDGRLAKAVLQSAKNAARVLTGVYPKGIATAAEQEVYPIVIVHSPLCSAPALNFWANQWFDQELMALRNDGRYANLDYSGIRPITLIEIDTIILYEEHFKSGKLNLFEMIDQYHHEMSMRATFNNETETKQHAFTQIPFAHFVRKWANQAGADIKFGRVEAILKKIGIN